MRGSLRIRSILGMKMLLFICHFDFSLARPTEQPTKFTLSTLEGSAKDTGLATTRLEQGRELLDLVADAIRIGRGRLVNFVIVARNIVVDRAENNQGRRSLEAIQDGPVADFRAAPQETVRLESETAQGLLERPFSKSVGGALEGFLRPTPLIDGIREEEKYGNSGDRFIGIGRALVGGFEGFSNFLNTVVDLPRNAIQKTSRGITEALNQVGARVIGLQ